MQSHSCGALTDSVPTNVQNNGKEFYLKNIKCALITHFGGYLKKQKTRLSNQQQIIIFLGYFIVLFVLCYGNFTGNFCFEVNLHRKEHILLYLYFCSLKFISQYSAILICPSITISSLNGVVVLGLCYYIIILYTFHLRGNPHT